MSFERSIREVARRSPLAPKRVPFPRSNTLFNRPKLSVWWQRRPLNVPGEPGYAGRTYVRRAPTEVRSHQRRRSNTIGTIRHSETAAESSPLSKRPIGSGRLQLAHDLLNRSICVDSRATRLPMIVCSCNVLSDHEVRSVVSTATHRTPSHVYGCLGCRVQCGRCAYTIRKIVEEMLDPANGGYLVGHAAHAVPRDEQLQPCGPPA